MAKNRYRLGNNYFRQLKVARELERDLISDGNQI